MNAPWLILLFPLVSAILIGCGLHRSQKISAALSLGAVWGAFAVTASYLPACFEHGAGWVLTDSFDWSATRDYTFTYGYLLDGLALIMLLVVTGVGGLIHIYALGYMQGDKGFARFFGFLSLFMFSMLGIVLADNFFQIFIHWELVGVSSFLLIGYYFEKPSANLAANKAFLTNRVGDFGFLIGILIAFYAFGTANFAEMGAKLTPEFLAIPQFQLGGAEGWTVTNETFLWVAGLLLLMGVMGKSAQFPLHVWLPDAMEGPTPVSALIHAATMVAAGVFLLVRIFFLYLPSDTAMTIVACMGGFTAFFAATIATAQFDIKRILAFSTLSQLGYMTLAIGLGGPDVAMFHLTNHAFFKACLFLGAGSVIHSVHTNDIREMGGLRKAMPVTFWTFMLSTLALCGVPPLSGFWSKDGILHLTHHAPAYATDNMFVAVLTTVLPTITAVLTAYYMFRCVILTFFGQPRGHGHPHESPATMTMPMVVLVVLAVLSGSIVLPAESMEFFRSIAHPADAAVFEPIEFTFSTVANSLLIVLLGAGAAWAAFSKGLIDPDKVKAALGPVYRLFENRWYVDNLYEWIVTSIQQNFARLCEFVDKRLIIGVVVNGAAWTTRATGALVARYQTGSVRAYVLLFLAGVAALLALNL